MPRPGLPLTPGSSSDIKGKDGTQQLSSFQLSFELPPPAIHDASRISPTMSSQVSPTDTKSHRLTTTSPEATYPMQPAEIVKARRRSSAAKDHKDNSFALPPPPTRSRKIIQMKPRQDGNGDNGGSKDRAKTTSKNSASAKTATAANSKTIASEKGDAAADDKAKKKQPSATSAAGRKIARKTAHSLIERRRRSKMNEEFSVLKGMIPACTGDMHKLSILQASIEYIRYLEDCVSKLKAQQEDDNGQTESGRQTPTGRDRLPSIREFHPTFQEDPVGDEDVEMEDSDATSPAMTAMSDRNPRHPSVSPALPPQDSRNRAQSYSSVSTDHRRYSYSVSAGTSPAFGPQIYGAPHYARSDASAPGSALTSPALNPQSELDQEAMAALLMLNNDRRDSKGRGLSVRDLLST
ncbi:Sterol regulatory element-binding 2 [Fusarium agapanthi]|uniref:Sterol regulatory element-binding 2 n=1 Tax=Fusarium agapanthi TaxID=1803897 RepID=A0A9P5B6T1_9HYPO|nr:Sterol regulatory element-binding 2 [Fusarium agapanthi]